MPEINTAELRKLSQQHAYASLQMHEAIARKAGFSGTDHKYLGFFLQKGKLTAGQLAELSGLTTGAVTGLIDRFEKKKLVKRQFDKSDRRKVFIVPDNKKILGLLQPYYKDFQKNTDRLIATFSPTEQKSLATFFEGYIKLLSDTTDHLNKIS